MNHEDAEISEFHIKEDCVDICVRYSNGFSYQGVSFDLEQKDLLKELFPIKEKVKVIYEGQLIDGLVNSKGLSFIKDPKWKKWYDEKLKKEAEIAAKKYHKEMMAIPEYKYESKYLFPDDMDISGERKKEGNGFRNSIHLSISRGMEYMDNKDLKDFSMREYANIKGVTEDNKAVDKLKNHIEKCVTKELGSRWGHSGFSMIYVTNQVLEAKRLGWDKYIDWVRSWKNKKEYK